MSHDMSRDQETAARIEARLERSLRHQVKAPRLDGRFDAAVWTRIAKESRAGILPGKAARMPRWLVASNVVGVAVTVVLLAWYAARALSGVELPPVDVELPLPLLSAETELSLMRITGTIIGASAMLYGVLCTRIGRRLVSQFR